jgi:hypothetical protein
MNSTRYRCLRGGAGRLPTPSLSKETQPYPSPAGSINDLSAVDRAVNSGRAGKQNEERPGTKVPEGWPTTGLHYAMHL